MGEKQDSAPGQRQKLTVFLGNIHDSINEAVVEALGDAFGDKYYLHFTVRHVEDDIYKLWQDRESFKGAHSPLLAAGSATVYKNSCVPCGEEPPWLAEGNLQFDISILVLNNILFKDKYSEEEKRKEKMLRIIGHARAANRKPVIALYGWPSDPSFAETAIDYGASAAFQLPFKIQDLIGAAKQCLSEEPVDSPDAISLLLPYYFDYTLPATYRAIGFKVLWAESSQEIAEKIVIGMEPDLALEWQYGANDFPIRDLLRKHGRKTPVVLMLNWANSVPGDFEKLGYAGHVHVPEKLDELMGLFYRVLPERKKKILQALCQIRGQANCA